MSDWLAPVRLALDARASPVATFVRDDDGGWADDRLWALLDVFAAHAVPIDVAVIPDALHPTLAHSLLDRHRDGHVHLHQHGRAHVNHEPAEQRKCEFGAARALDDLGADVAAGRQRLTEFLGDAAEPVFTPPWNRCVAELGDVLAAAGHRVLSRDRSAGRVDHPAVVEVPVTVDWFGSTKGARWTREELAERIAAELLGDEPVGVMLHHGVTDDDELAAVAQLAGLLAAHPAAAPTSILELAADATA